MKAESGSILSCRLSRGEWFVYILVSLALMVVAGYRAATVAFFHDEAVSYLAGVLPGLRHLLQYDLYIDAGNHFLNTVGMYLSHKTFGSAEWSLRLPSMIGLLVWLISSVRMAFLLSGNQGRRLVYFLFLQANPILFDYFSAARGYGLSCAFVLASMALYLDKKQMAGRSLGRDLCVILLAGAAVLSNLITLYVFTALTFCVVGERFLKVFRGHVVRGGEGEGWPTALLAAAAILPLAIVLPHIQKLLARRAFYFGGTDGLVADSVSSMVSSYSVGFQGPLLMAAAWGVILASVMLLCMAAARLRSTDARPLYFRGGLVAISVMLQPVAAFHLLGSRYPVDRTALFLLPVLVPPLLMLMEIAMLRMRIGKAVVSGLLLFGLVLLNIRMIQGRLETGLFGFSHFESSSREALKDVSEHVVMSGLHQPISLGVDWILEPTVNYYRLHLNYDWLDEVNRRGYYGNHDYFYQYRGNLDPLGDKVLRNDHDFLFISDQSWSDEVQGVRYRIIHRYEQSETILAVKRSLR